MGTRSLAFVLAIALGAPLSAQVTQLLDVSSTGIQGNGQPQDVVATISSDGRYVAFDNTASNLVPGDTNGTRDVFLRDRVEGTTIRVSVGQGGVQGNALSSFPQISAGGHYVLFTSSATNLVPGDTNDSYDAFVYDVAAGTTERVSVGLNGIQGNNRSSGHAITPDGRFVVIVSDATNFLPQGTFNTHVFVRDRQSDSIEIADVSSTGQVSNNAFSSWGSISADGRFVCFSSYALNLVPGDTNDWADMFVRDRLTGITERVSVDSNGNEANSSLGTDVEGRISSSGRYVAFVCDASNLAPGDTNGYLDVFVHDRRSGLTERVSVGPAGAESDSGSHSPWVSGDGRYVVFQSWANNLVTGDSNHASDVFIRDRTLGTTERVSVTSDGSQANGRSGDEWLHATDDGRYIVFNSRASNLALPDTNAGDDVFLRDRFGGTAFTSLCHPGVGSVMACPCANSPAGPNQGCDNSAGTGGAVLSASGGTFLSSDSLVFTTSGEGPTTLSVFMQGDAPIPNGVTYGQGVRCAGGALKRLYTKSAVGGSSTAPDFSAGDQQVSVRSAARGDLILLGQSRWYFVAYRAPAVLGGCPAGSTFNTTQTGQISWWP